MKLQTISPSVPEMNDKSVVRDLYNRYGGMLLGYLTDVLGERREAEKYLVDIFNELPHQLNNLFGSEKSHWLQLQDMAKDKLAPFVNARQDCSQMEDTLHQKWTAGGSNLARLSAMQRSIFCGIYYHRKSVAAMAQELNKPESAIKIILKEAFNIVKNGR